MESKLRPAILVKSILGLSLALVLGVAPSVAGTPVLGNCISASVGEPIRLPTGDEHPSGRLTLCVTRHFSPVATLHKTYVDGMLIGLLQSRRAFSEGAVERPFMMFHRDIEGRLNLYGFATPAGSRMATYRLGVGNEELSTSSMARGAAAGAGALVLTAQAGPAR